MFDDTLDNFNLFIQDLDASDLTEAQIQRLKNLDHRIGMLIQEFDVYEPEHEEVSLYLVEKERI